MEDVNITVVLVVIGNVVINIHAPVIFYILFLFFFLIFRIFLSLMILGSGLIISCFLPTTKPFGLIIRDDACIRIYYLITPQRQRQEQILSPVCPSMSLHVSAMVKCNRRWTRRYTRVMSVQSKPHATEQDGGLR